MHKNLFWQGFLAVVLLTTLGYSAVAVYRYYQYVRLTAETPTISAMQWDVEQKADDEFIIGVQYVFKVGQQEFKGETKWPKERFLNRYAAEEGIKEFSARKWRVWYDSSDPHHSSLEKNFPFKECLSALFLWGLFFYFLWLGFYVAKFKS